MKIKICGITQLDQLEACFTGAVDYVGFNFFAPSKRYIKPIKASLLWSQCLDNNIENKTQPIAVGLFVNATEEYIRGVLAEFPQIQVLQLHGDESAESLATLRPIASGRSIWKALGVYEPADLEAGVAYLKAADLLLFDAKVGENSSGEKIYGGSGISFDHQILKKLPPDMKFALAGGIGLENLSQVMQLKPEFIDICSGVESDPGKKSPELIAKLMKEFRANESCD